MVHVTKGVGAKECVRTSGGGGRALEEGDGFVSAIIVILGEGAAKAAPALLLLSLHFFSASIAPHLLLLSTMSQSNVDLTEKANPYLRIEQHKQE
jgi:hypothetical protein